jgi:hypothetical protein
MSTELNAAPTLPQSGDELNGPEIKVDAERLQVYGDGLLTSAADKPVHVGANIHTDVEYAKEQGLDAPIVDGMLSVNYLSSLLTRAYGQAYIEHGELQCKFIRPVYADEVVRPRAVVGEREAGEDGRERQLLETWVETEDGTKVVVGKASVEL